MKLKLRTRLLVFVTTMIVAVLLLSASSFYGHFSRYVKDSAQDQAGFVRRMYLALQASRAQDLIAACRALADTATAESAQAAPGDSLRLAAQAVAEAGRRGRYRLALAVDAESRLLSAHGWPAAAGERITQVDLLTRALQSEECWGVVACGDALVLTAATPVMSAGAPVGALAIGSPLDDELAAGLAAASRASLALLAAGRVRASAIHAEEPGGVPRAAGPAVREALEAAAARVSLQRPAGATEWLFELDVSGERQLVLWAPLHEGTPDRDPSVMILESLGPARRATRRLLGFLAIVGVAGFLTALLLSRLAAAAVVRPIRNLAEQLQYGERPRPDSGTAPALPLAAPAQVSDELDDLAERIERLVVEKQQALGDLRNATDRLRQAQKMEAVGRLAGGIAHDFNNLLTVIQGHVDFLADGLGPSHPQIDDVQTVMSCSVKAARLVRQLLAFGGKQLLSPKLVSPNELLRRLDGLLKQATDGRVALTMDLAADCGRVRVDPAQLEDVVVNLVTNARDASSAGGTVQIRTSNCQFNAGFAAVNGEGAAGDYVCLAVRDEGRGMDAPMVTQIFEPFFTTKERGSEKGTGLGLAMVYGTVTQSGGYITVESAPGKGSAFRILLPRVQEQSQSQSATVKRSALPGGRETLLIVEDEDHVRALAERILAGCGYRVLAASGPEQALEICASHDGDIQMIVSDVLMPGMSGPELVPRLCRQRPGLRVLFMSGYTSGTAELPVPLLGQNRLLEKPFTPSELAQAVREVLDGPSLGSALGFSRER